MSSDVTNTDVETLDTVNTGEPTFSEKFWKVFRGHPGALAGLIGITIFVLLAIFAPLIAPQDPYDQAQLDILDGLLPPGSTLWDGTPSLLGTDALGRDILSAVLYGLRISLFVALVAVIVGSAIGVFMGLLAAMKGGWVETAIMRAVDLKMSFPGILLALMVLAVFGSGIDKVIIALIIGAWASEARLVRAVALSELKKEYIDAARLAGLSDWRIMGRFLFPNSISPVLVVLPMSISGAIGAEATLSFLGVGVPITEPSLGLLIANGNDYILSGKWWISLFPGLVLVAMVLCINMVADRLRDHANPYLRGKD
ncbi:ABC transporter permease [Thalassobius sp. Cn5-15]|uniref:ABC transporter permease n=1 Tax=Thalassobius sp. Cn5-15 TaxID=2917763 RepID=UPI001EF2F22B|nr:ABC transporter permease [Thalassobius sp. Cn5-15]MCG7494307.1 ABC transporter permease [Thalassobius sp. Cn5-15]